MADAEPSPPSGLPAPLTIGGYAGWTWQLFRASYARFILVYMGGVAFVRTVHFLLVVAVAELTSGRSGDVATLATSLASGITLAAVAGSVLAALAGFSFAAHVCDRTVRPGEAWRHVRSLLSQVVVAALYVSMPLVLLLFVVGPSVEILLTVMILPALLGPPVLVHSIAWEGKGFRDAATRAKNLLAGSWGRVLSALILLSLGAALVQILVLTMIGGLVGGGSPDEPVEYALALVLEVATTGTVWLFTSAAATVAYLDLRARFEGLDPAGLASEADALTPVGTAPNQG